MATAHLLPVLEDVLNDLSFQSVARLQGTGRHVSEAVNSWKPGLLTRRGFGPQCSLRKAHAFEVALFSDARSDPDVWTPGPNGQSPCNTLASDSNAAPPWLWLSGGTDWQGFQGGFCCVSESGIRPSWVCFRVRVATPALAGASLTLSSDRFSWGLTDPVLVFTYRGDEGKQRRCFVVQTGATQHGHPSYKCGVDPEVVTDKPYEVAMYLDWKQRELSVFIDGFRQVDRVPLKADKADPVHGSPIRFAAIHNWRSQARTAFSELLLGDSCPFKLHGEVPGEAPSSYCQRYAQAVSARCPCRERRRRWARASELSIRSMTLSPAAFAALTTAAAAVAVPMILQWAAASHGISPS
mmetsp:Transcript_8474/g.16058  ORF Transcript_8474/g.16058 Transcript_8474/m.16058 type:complete len:353 (-) Transcript_8474:93-1151(-)